MCLCCGKETTNPKFCSQSCAATYNNKLYPKRAINKELKICSCGGKKDRRSNSCKTCSRANTLSKIQDMTKEDALNLTGSRGSVYNAIRHHARVWASQFKQECQICGYNKAVQVCHIKGISSFPNNTPIRVINAGDNLVLLCPNHHWELDHNLLTGTIPIAAELDTAIYWTNNITMQEN